MSGGAISAISAGSTALNPISPTVQTSTVTAYIGIVSANEVTQNPTPMSNDEMAIVGTAGKRSTSRIANGWARMTVAGFTAYISPYADAASRLAFSATGTGENG